MPNEFGKTYRKLARPSNMVEQELADMLTDAALREDAREANWKYSVDNDELPLVPAPPKFQRGTQYPVTGIGEFSDEEDPWAFIERIAPQMIGRASAMKIGPTYASIDDTGASGFSVEDYPYLNLYGIYDKGRKDISINPRLANVYKNDFKDDPNVLRDLYNSVVAHEMGHSVGIKHGRKMNNLQGLMLMARDAERMKK